MIEGVFMDEHLYERVRQIDDLEGVLHLHGQVNRIRKKQKTIKQEIQEMRSIFKKLADKIELVSKEQKKPTPKPEKIKDEDKLKKWYEFGHIQYWFVEIVILKRC